MGAQAKKSAEPTVARGKAFPKIIYRRNGPPILAPLGPPSIPEEKIREAVATAIAERKAREKAARAKARAKKT